MRNRSPRSILAAIALVLPFFALGCEEQGVPSVSTPDTATVVSSAKSSDADPAPASSATEDANKTASAGEDKDAEDKDAEDKDAEDKDAEDKDAEDKDAADKDASKATAKPTDTKTAAGDASAKPADKEPEPTVGEKKVEGSYAAWLQSSGKYSVNKPGSVVAVVSAQGEYHCNEKYPYKFKLGSAPSGVSFGADTVRGASVGKSRASLSIPFTPTSTGPKTISGTYYFSVCNEDTCQIKKQAMSVTVNVE